MMGNLVVLRAVGDRLVGVGLIVRAKPSPIFAYDPAYLTRADAVPLSVSLPLGDTPFEEVAFRPYFEGLLPEGPTREALAAELAAQKSDYLTLLGANGFDCIGDVVVCDEGEPRDWGKGCYRPLDDKELRRTMSTLASQASSNSASRLSLAGTQGKVGLAHVPGTPLGEGWLRPEGGAASTHILKKSNLSRISEFELVCMGAAESCGLTVAHTAVCMLGAPIICSERFDRRAVVDGQGLTVRRLHQEDLAQAFGCSSAAKYVELEGGTYHAIAELLYERSSAALEDISQLARLAVFDYLVGNCDNHLKNLSVLHEGRERLRLAPAYDLVCTTFFERFSRDMGRRLGSTREIDAVEASDFVLLARDLGVGQRLMKRVCAEVTEAIVPAIAEAGERHAEVLPALPYTAEDLIGDMGPRLAVVAQAARQ